MSDFLNNWGKAANTSVGFFWMALWAFALGYLISSLIQVFVTEHRMKKLMGEDENESFISKVKSAKNWAKVAKQYTMEWKMVWKDVTIGFTIAGIVAVFVPDSFFQSLFINSGNSDTHYTILEILEHIVVGPVAAFLTFIGSMGNIPLAALLFSKNVSFAGVMAFIFSDLVIFPVLRINAKYYGWKTAFFILFLLFSSLIFASLALHYSFEWLHILPDSAQTNLKEMTYFKTDYSIILNFLFLFISGFLVWLGLVKYKKLHYMKEMASKGKMIESVLKYLAYLSYAWLIIGLGLHYL